MLPFWYFSMHSVLLYLVLLPTVDEAFNYLRQLPYCWCTEYGVLISMWIYPRALRNLPMICPRSHAIFFDDLVCANGASRNRNSSHHAHDTHAPAELELTTTYAPIHAAKVSAEALHYQP